MADGEAKLAAQAQEHLDHQGQRKKTEQQAGWQTPKWQSDGER
jgi:hypothetical protein